MEVSTGTSITNHDVTSQVIIENTTSSVTNVTKTREGTTLLSSSLTTTDQIVKYIYVAIGSLGMVGNLIVLMVILNVPTMRKKLTNIYIINQSFIDFCVSLFLIAGSTVNGGEVPYSGLTGLIYCKLWSTKLFLWGFLVSSTYNLVALTLERYLEVVHPIWHKLTFTKSKAYVSLACVWLIGPGFNALYMIPTSTIKADGQCSVYSEWPDEIMPKVFGVFTVILQYFVPLGVLIYSYGRIAHRLTKQGSKVGDKKSVPPPGGVTQKEDRYQKARRNTIKTLAIVAMVFVLCWSWNQIYYTMMNLGYPSDFVSPFYHFTVIAVFINCCVNPFIYALKYEQFKAAAKKMFCKCLKKRTQTNINNTIQTVSTIEGHAEAPSNVQF